MRHPRLCIRSQLYIYSISVTQSYVRIFISQATSSSSCFRLSSGRIQDQRNGKIHNCSLNGPCSVRKSDVHIFLSTPTNALECIDVTLLHCNHRHVSTTRVTILRVMVVIIHVIIMFVFLFSPS